MKPEDAAAAREILEKLLANTGDWSGIAGTQMHSLAAVPAWLETVAQRLLTDTSLAPTAIQMKETHHLVPLCIGREAGLPEETDSLVLLQRGRWRYWFTDCLMAVELPVLDPDLGDPQRMTIIWSTQLHCLLVVAWNENRAHVRLSSHVPPAGMHRVEPSIARMLARLSDCE
jgi:hypothetical protein